jgi:hypothetical protein
MKIAIKFLYLQKIAESILRKMKNLLYFSNLRTAMYCKRDIGYRKWSKTKIGLEKSN